MRYQVWSPDADQTAEDARRCVASSAEEAAELWAKAYDEIAPITLSSGGRRCALLCARTATHQQIGHSLSADMRLRSTWRRRNSDEQTQRCGNCRYFSPQDGPWESICVFGVDHIARPLPEWVKDEIKQSRENGTDQDDGEGCEAWEAKP